MKLVLTSLMESLVYFADSFIRFRFAVNGHGDEAAFPCRIHEWQLYDNGEAFDVGRSLFYRGLVQWINMYI